MTFSRNIRSPNNLDYGNDRNEVSGSDEAREYTNHRSKARRSRNRRNAEPANEAQRRSDQEWAKSILSRRTGYGCIQRNQVVKYISQLERSLGELQTKIAKLSPQVIQLDQDRWILQGENDYLKEKIAELSRQQHFKADENSALQEELQSLKTQHVERVKQDSVPSSEEGLQAGLQAGSSRNGMARMDLRRLSEPSRRQGASVGTRAAIDELNGFAHEPSESSNSGSATDMASKEPEFSNSIMRTTSTRLSLVKWPSSLYRSVSAIRKDVLEVAIEEATKNNEAAQS